VKKVLQITILCFFVTGCGSTLKQGWNDFTAYYNTFYNANQFYDEGLKKNLNQVPSINPINPIRIHPSPTAAGHSEFEEAIERASSILRNHSDSRYVNPAVFLIGKSFYYRSEYFAALEKFQELQTLGNSQEQQEAILWQGRTYLEMSNYSEGIQFLEIELDLFENWDPAIRAEIGLLLAQMFVEQDNWEASLNYMQSSIDYLEDDELISRAYFLFGQILEQFGRNSNALIAYRQIRNVRADFDLEYHALRKEAEVSRKVGDYDRSIRLFRELERDDKFFEYHTDLQYEIAKTYQEKGDPDRALELYNRLLTDRFQNPSPVTRAKTFYGIAEIYRFNRDDFQMAAAYYDSAASERGDLTGLPRNFNASELAESFGEYAALKQQIAHNDSLLYLGSLEGAELDSVIAEIQQQRVSEMESQSREMQNRQSRVVNVDEPDSIVEASEATEHGFLNVKNPVLIADASLQFQAIWGDRPLADNWRRRADVSGSRFDQFVILDTDDEEIELQQEEKPGVAQAGVDLSGIPFDEDARRELQRNNEELNYQLGNVFLLSLELPDSAKTYFNKVLESSLDRNLASRSLYTLAELELSLDNREQAKSWFDQLAYEFPNSEYTQRLASRLDMEIDYEQDQEATDVRLKYYDVKNSDLPPAEMARELQKIAYTAESESERSEILFDAAREYAKAGRQNLESESEIDRWFQKQIEIQEKRDQFTTLQDSARVMLSDTTLTEEELGFWEQISDSTFNETDFLTDFPFEGVYWDSTRSVLNHIETYYASSRVMPGVRMLKQSIERPKAEKPEEPDVPEESGMIEEDDDIQSCEDMNILPDIDGGIDGFISSITFPAWTNDITMRGEVTYLFTVDPDGGITDYEQVSSMDRSGIPQSIENAIDRLLRFTSTGTGEPVQCTLTFPIDL